MFYTIAEWLDHLKINELLSGYGQTIKTSILAILVFLIIWLFIKVSITAIMLPYTLKKSQKVMESIIANAENEFGKPEIKTHIDSVDEEDTPH